MQRFWNSYFTYKCSKKCIFFYADIKNLSVILNKLDRIYRFENLNENSINSFFFALDRINYTKKVLVRIKKFYLMNS